MCRLLAVVSSGPTSFRFSLSDAPRSLACMSREHPDGWGVAIHARRTGWAIHKQASCAASDGGFASLSASALGELLVAHVRKRTVGPAEERNTHPFRRGRWVFAHNGTIEDLAHVGRRTSETRRREIEGATDSEAFFAMLLTALDEIGAGDGVAGLDRRAIDRALSAAVSLCLERPSFGSVNFLLCDGDVLYAHRAGRTLFLLGRGDGDRVITSRTSGETDAVIETAWGARRHAVLIASERLTSEPWAELADRTLLRVDACSRPTWTLVSAAAGSPTAHA